MTAGEPIVLKNNNDRGWGKVLQRSQSNGKGLLKMDNGTVFKPNDRYPLTKDVFRLYYTSLSTDRQTIDVYVEDSFGKVQQLTFSFNNEREEGKDKPASSRH